VGESQAAVNEENLEVEEVVAKAPWQREDGNEVCENSHCEKDEHHEVEEQGGVA